MSYNYQFKIAHTESQAAYLQRKSVKYSWYRGGAAIGFFLSIWIGTLSLTLGAVVAILSFITFGWLVYRHNQIERKIVMWKQLTAIYQNERTIQERNLFGNGSEFIDDQHNYSSDLDLFGKKSLFAYLNRTVTSEGKALLASFLLKRSSAEEILHRQTLSVELSQKESFKEDFLATYFLSQPKGATLPKGLQSILNSDNDASAQQEESERIHAFIADFTPFFQSKRWLLWVAYLLPCLLIGSLLLAFIEHNRWGIVTLCIFCLNSLLAAALNLRITKIHAYVGKHGALFQKYAKLMSLIKKETFIHPELQAVQQRLIVQHQFDQKLERIAWLTKMLDTRDSSIIWLILNTLFLWDVHCVYAIEKWFIYNRTALNPALEEVGRVDAYLSLAIFRLNHPTFSFPELCEGYFTMEAVEMGHPLIAESTRVNNNFTIRKGELVGIVTGSNMSGKSTFLRTLGVNMVLAYAGFPVCADSFSLSMSDIQTYMRTRDSLSENTSSFRAELMRLKKIIEEVKRNPHCFLLLDELLKGTNSTDKYLGSVAIVNYLLTHQAVGLVATHDLALTEMERQHPNAICNYHFDITIAGEELYFDYKLCHGACKTFNAKLLLKKIGIVIESPEHKLTNN